MDSRYRWDGLWQYALLGVAGFVLFGGLFQRYSPAPHLNITLDRAAAIARARTIAQDLGWPVNDWEVRAWTTDAPDEVMYYGTRNPEPTVKQWLPPVRFNVHFRSLTSPQTVRVRLAGSGQLIRFDSPQSFADDNERRGAPGPPPPPPPRPRGGPTPEPTPKAEQASPANAQLAEQTVQRYFQADFQTAGFSGAPTVTSTRQGFDFTWKKNFPNDPRLTLEAEVEVAQDRVQRVDLTPQFASAFQTEASQADEPDFIKALTIGAVVWFLLVLVAMVFVLFDALSRNEVRQRPALRLLFGALFVFLAVNTLSGYQEVINIGANTPNRWLTIALRMLIFTLLMAFFALLVYVIWIAGHALVARRAGRRTVAFELLLAGRFTHSYVARQFLIGLCCASLYALLPYLLKATFFRSATLALPDDFAIFGARLPALMTFSEITVLGVFLLFAFGVPLIESYVPRWSLAALLILTLGGWAMFDGDHFPYSGGAQLVTGLLTMSLLYWLYRQHDLLTVLVTVSAGYAVLHGTALFAQPVASIRLNGLIVFIALAAAALISLLFVKRGAALDEKLFEPLHVGTTSIERERLKAELEVATRAQQQMLPAAPPHIPGLEIAASCNPSKDVGGDLFDFLKLPDGRFGIVVADVSGKGVPAALYMTLTKGVLASVTEYESDPGAILRETNRHLYEACRRKVFVTLFLGVYDPATRVMTYARAGHNPTVYRSPARNHTELLKPRGMGLGLAGEKTFNPPLTVASLQLHTDDLLIFYSDGITEAMNNQQEEYGEERLIEVAVQHDGSNAATAHDAVLADVKNFLGKVAPQDDQTLVVLRVCET